MSIDDDDIFSSPYLLYILPFFQELKKSQEQMWLQVQHKCLEIPKVFRDREFSNPPYDIHSQEAGNLDKDKYIKCVMATMTYHAEVFINAYNVMVP